MTISLLGKFNSIDTPEMSINLPAELQGNDVVVKSEGNIEILYRGWAKGLRFSDFDIMGNAVVQKIKRTKKTIYKRTNKVVGIKKVLGLFAVNVYETEPVEEKIVGETVLVEIWANKPHNWNHMFFILDGKISSYYWVGIVADAANQGIILSPQLRSAIFGSIEQQLMGFYKQVKEFASEP